MFYFAWVEDGSTTFGVEHHVVDEAVFSFNITHAEGGFPALTAEFINPRVGLLNEDRPRWCWLSWKKPDDSVVPLFHGELVGVPEDLQANIITLAFRGRPQDFEAQKEALADSLKVYPYWDPAFIDETLIDDPDVAWEARPELWHVGRTDKLVTSSHYLIGEAGTIAIGESDIYEDSLTMNYGEEPISKVHMDVTVSWNQFATGTVDMSRILEQAFEEAGSNPFTASSYTGQGLEADWPRAGMNIGGGWTVEDSRVRLLSGGGVTESYIETDILPRAEDEETAWQAITERPIPARFYLWVFDPTFVVRYQATRARKEILSFDVQADMQDLLTGEEPKTLLLTETSDLVGEPVDSDETRPIGDIRSRSYFATDRGDQSLAFLLNKVRSAILLSARTYEISFEVPFITGVPFSCRHDIVVTSPKIPGGEAQGKIIAYSLSMDGDTSEMKAGVTIGCSVGRGNTLPAAESGEPTWVEEGWVDDWQHYAGGTIQPLAGELEYEDFIVTPVDDNVDFFNMTPENVIEDTAASALLTFSAAGVAGETITIGARVYTLVAALTGANDVLIGGDEDATALNLASAINREEAFEGIRFGTGTVAHADVSAEANEGIVRATARVAGVGGNSISVSETSTVADWATATLIDGDDGLVVVNGVAAQENVLGESYETVDAAIEALNAVFTQVQLALIKVEGGPFETLISLTVSDLMVPKTVDLEAA